ncbi:MAG: leucyl aminopeptidase family protein [Planctomycetota bacterium]|nr:MAG: leucyl aminopeptidase family protein [Planctomycetota bacterium]
MRIDHQSLSPRHDLRVLFVRHDQTSDGHTAWAGDLPEVLYRHVSDRPWRLQLIPSHGLIPQPWLALVPLSADAVELRRRGGQLARLLAEFKLERIHLGSLPDFGAEWPASRMLGLLLPGFAQGAYAFTRYQASKRPPSYRLSVSDAVRASDSRAWTALAELTQAARDLINTPAMDAGPAQVVTVARRLCRNQGVKVTVYDRRRLQQLGCGCILAVGAAAARDRAARMLVLDYPGKGAGAKQKPIVICGKGVCFDSGGLQIKPGAAMQLMRKDMGGAATVLAAVLAHARQGGRRRLRAYLPLVENAISGEAFRPGDVLTAADGTTIEVGHTDAEGRLVLADALALGRRDKPAALLTVATLTGAALVALGRIHVPLMATDHALADALLAASAARGEKMWRLPLDDEHRAMVRSSLAVLTNSAGPEAACITAGAFLAHFAGDIPFAHLDISPASWRDKGHDLGPAGATGVMIDSLCQFFDSY